MIKHAETSPFSQSRWIWPESHRWDIHNGYALFRKAFELAELPAGAPLFITADQSYQLYLNGRYVCRGPARGFQSHWPYDEVDARPYLRPGRNVLAVRAYNPGRSNFQYVSQGYAGLLVAARWGPLSLVSDSGWRGRRQTGVNPASVPSSLQLFCQEHIDLRQEPPDWMQPEFDDRGWTSPLAEHPWNGMPWDRLEPRGIPMLEELPAPLPRVLGAAAGPCAPGHRDTRDVTRLRHAEGLRHEPADLAAGELRIEPTGPGRFRSYLLDFGKTVVGSLGFEVLGATGGEILDTLHAETLDPASLTVDFTPDKHCRMAFGHRLVCRPGDQTHTFYHTFGFRHVVVTLRDSTAPLRLRPHLRTTLYPLKQAGSFHSSDPALERIWEACAWTQRVCSLDAYVDTPWREQAQWWGDARVQAKNTFFYSGDTRLFRRGLAQIAAQTGPNGLTYGHAPTMAHNCILPDFTLIWLITLWDFYWQTGSLEPFLAHEKTIEGTLRYFEEVTDDETGLLAHDPRYWLFLDWSGIFKDGYPAVYNLWLLIALDRLAALYRRARRPEPAARLDRWSARLRPALQKLIREDGLLADGLTFDRQPVRAASVHAQTLAILAGLQPDGDAGRIRQSLLPFIQGTAVPENPPSCFWITHVFEVLTAAGHGEDVTRFIREHWAPMARHGTTWEVFAPRVGDESFSHAWSAHPLYHLMQGVGGIRQDAPGWAKIVFEPVLLGAHASATVPTPLGPAGSAWKKNGGRAEVRLQLPAGMTATVRLPGREPFQVGAGDSTWLLDLGEPAAPDRPEPPRAAGDPGRKRAPLPVTAAG